MKKGFSLIEFLVASAIIVIIATMLVSLLGQKQRLDISRSYGVGQSVYIKTLNITGIVNRVIVRSDTTNVSLLVSGTNGVPVQINDIDIRLLEGISNE